MCNLSGYKNYICKTFILNNKSYSIAFPWMIGIPPPHPTPHTYIKAEKKKKKKKRETTF